MEVSIKNDNLSPKHTLRLACCLSEKKTLKFDWKGFELVCKKFGYELFKVDINVELESQGPFHVFLHKLTDLIASAKEGDPLSVRKIEDIEKFFEQNPSIAVIDPIPNVRKLLDRHVCYQVIRCTALHNYRIFTPNFCELKDVSDISKNLKSANVTYPFICKPILGHGSKEAHEMSIIFNENQLGKCKIPCVAQSFINHNAILYKIFIVGSKYSCMERPSIKNFHSTEHNVINFRSSDVSKAGTRHNLSVLDPEDEGAEKISPDPKVIDEIARTVRKEFGMDLLGVDFVISNRTSRYAIIDINAFPGYDGFPNFFDGLLECVDERRCDYFSNHGTSLKKTDPYIASSA